MTLPWKVVACLTLLPGSLLACAFASELKAGAGFVDVRLPVTVLPTSDGLVGYSRRYPKTISVQIPKALLDHMGVYGAAYGVWLGPKGWTGDAGYGADGSALIHLHPPSAESGEELTYSEIPACYACTLGAAAPFFESARRAYESTYDKDGTNPIAAKLPGGIRVKSISASLVTYTVPDSNGVATRGVVFYGRSGQNGYYANAKFSLRASQMPLIDFLEAQFITRHRAK